MRGGTGWRPGWPGTRTRHRLAALPAGSSGDVPLTGGSLPPGTVGNLWRRQAYQEGWGGGGGAGHDRQAQRGTGGTPEPGLVLGAGRAGGDCTGP